MATSKQLSDTIRGSDECVGQPCQPCFTNTGTEVEASYTCGECGDMCTACRELHARIPSLRKHYVAKIVSPGNPIRITLERNRQVNTSDQSMCDIGGVCLFSGKTFILADRRNQCIKRLDATKLVVVETFRVVGMPYDVCRTEGSEVAVTFPYMRKIQLITLSRSTNSMELVRSFTVDGFCRGICHSNGELYVCCEGIITSDHKINVYSLSGEPKRTIQQLGGKLLPGAYYITASVDGSKLHLTDGDQHVITMTTTGVLLSTYTDAHLRPSGICSLRNGDLLVSGCSDGTVVQICGDRKVAKVLDGREDRPLALCCDIYRDRLIVSWSNSNTILIYTIQYD